jgi:hypothetical protein
VIEDFKVRKGLWDAETKIAKVERKRHTVIFPETDRPTTVTFCNNCGCPMTIKPDDPSSGLPNKCAQCWEDQ